GGFVRRTQKMAERQTAFDDKRNSDKCPKNDAPLSNNSKRDADAGGHSDRFRDKIRTGFVNTDKERHEFENDRNQTADTFEQKGIQQGPVGADPAEHEPDLEYAKSVIGELQNDDRQKTFRVAAVKIVYQVF